MDNPDTCLCGGAEPLDKATSPPDGAWDVIAGDGTGLRVDLAFSEAGSAFRGLIPYTERFSTCSTIPFAEL